ncbi:hypothetical protein [Aquisphaera insulae]|uniref:hypothetical protein n=1 Tax=Aquisphaera insulae TaxID=2712864 RepID=UPI0013ECC011|nr:hypothetical protein [Aquisphaera insulae]
MEPERKPEPASDELDYYAPPRSELEPVRADMFEGPGVVPFEVGRILAATWIVFRNRMWVTLGIAWAVFLLMLATGQIQTRIASRLSLAPADRAAYYLVQFVLFVGGYVLSTWLSLGQNLAFLSVSRGEEAPSNRLFQGWPYVLTSLLASLVLTVLLLGVLVIILTPASIIAEVAGRDPLFFAAGVGLGVVVISYVGIRMSQFNYFIVDQDLGITDSLRASWESTREAAGKLFVLYVSLLFINVAGLCCLVIGLIFTVPFSTLALAVAYLSLTGQPLAPREDIPETWAEDEPSW